MLVVLPWVLAACSAPPGGPALTQQQLMDPASCKTCHPDAYREWSGSMHAYASEDPVFRAMNQRGQRETNGALGTFCLNCHAPMAVRTGATTDGSNLDALPDSLKGVSCYFCHSVDAVEGTHNNPLRLASDGVMRGGHRDPMQHGAHASAWSPLMDRDQAASATMCGSCHDVRNGHGLDLEQTFAEWKDSVFSRTEGGATCGQCHMPASLKEMPASTMRDSPLRRVHDHTMPGVDVALTPFPEREEQRRLVEEALAGTVQSALCVLPQGANSRLQLVLDNGGAGHGFPSGATSDRRFWAEVLAEQGGVPLYSSGVVLRPRF